MSSVFAFVLLEITILWILLTFTQLQNGLKGVQPHHDLGKRALPRVFGP